LLIALTVNRFNAVDKQSDSNLQLNEHFCGNIYLLILV